MTLRKVILRWITICPFRRCVPGIYDTRELLIAVCHHKASLARSLIASDRYTVPRNLKLDLALGAIFSRRFVKQCHTVLSSLQYDTMHVCESISSHSCDLSFGAEELSLLGRFASSRWLRVKTRIRLTSYS